MQKQPDNYDPLKDPTRQPVTCGAAIQLTETVLKEGVIFVHDKMPIFKLMMHYDEQKNIISDYSFELIKPKDETISGFAIMVIAPPDPEQPKIKIPKKRKLIIPERGSVN